MADGANGDVQLLKWVGTEAPRYTSYPSAHHFSAQVGIEQQSHWLQATERDAGISVYVHIPFCKELCWFCGCSTKMTKKYDPIAKYVRILLKEIALLKPHVNGKGQLINIHFGGGSPSLLSQGDMLAILYAISDAFGGKPSGEQAIELDPRTTTAENIKAYAAMGFNRVSIGIQDFNTNVQMAINRVQCHAMVSSVVQQLRDVGLDQINFDLIYGLPHQTLDRFHNTLEKTIALNPVRIALFSYAHVPQVKKHQRMIDVSALPSELAKLDLYTHACEVLSAHGYEAIGIDHFAKHDDPLAIAMHTKSLRRNFQGYVNDSTNILLGIGSSAISQFPQGYTQNSASVVQYGELIKSGHLPCVRGLEFKNDDHIRKHVIDHLMCFLSVDLAKIRAHYGLMADYFQHELCVLRGDDYTHIVAIEGESIRLTTSYRMAIRAIAAVFDTYHAAAAGRYSKVA